VKIEKAVGTPVIVGSKGARQLDQVKLESKGEGKGPYDERWLQELIFENPACLPMDQIEPGLSRLIPICMELPLRRGSLTKFLDNLFLTPDGDIVIVEVKLWRNHEMRRNVLAQALSYASALFSMNYEELDQAVRTAEGSEGKSVFEIVDGADALEEPDFIDAVVSNLKTGRIVVLVVGDGIREELEALVTDLQSHAGFRFTFALVELSVFHSETTDLIVVPRTLAKTYMIERWVIRHENEGGSVSLAPVKKKLGSTKSDEKTISSETFYEKMREIDENLPEKIHTLLEALSQFGVYPEFKKSMLFRWTAPEGNTVTLGYVQTSGSVWFDDADVVFLNCLAEKFGWEVVDGGNGYSGKMLKVGGKRPKIADLAGNPEGMVTAMRELIAKLRDS